MRGTKVLGFWAFGLFLAGMLVVGVACGKVDEAADDAAAAAGGTGGAAALCDCDATKSKCDKKDGKDCSCDADCKVSTGGSTGNTGGTTGGGGTGGRGGTGGSGGGAGGTGGSTSNSCTSDPACGSGNICHNNECQEEGACPPANRNDSAQVQACNDCQDGAVGACVQGDCSTEYQAAEGCWRQNNCINPDGRSINQECAEQNCKAQGEALNSCFYRCEDLRACFNCTIRALFKCQTETCKTEWTSLETCHDTNGCTIGQDCPACQTQIQGFLGCCTTMGECPQ